MAIKNKLATQDFAKEVVYAPADLTPEQQAQAQKNIGLPEITSEDAGLVLGVSEEGKWELNLVSGGGGEGSGVQSDWNVSNKSSLAYIKNKPFYEETNAWVPLISSTEFSPFNLMASYGVYAYERRAKFDGFAIGETYRITWDGITYECVAQDSSGVIANTVACGNCAPFGLSGNGEPFIIVYTNNGGKWETYCALTDTADGGAHTVGIEGIGTVIHKIDPKYLHASDWNVIDKNKAGYIANRPFGTIPAGTVILEETTFQFQSNTLHLFDLPDIGPFDYIVEFDGTSYPVTGQVFETTNLPQCGFSIVGDDGNTVATFVKNFEGHDGVDVIAAATPGAHTFKIILAEDVIEKIDSKYLPDDIGGSSGPSLPEVTTEDAGKFLRVTDEGIWAAVSIPNAEGAEF